MDAFHTLAEIAVAVTGFASLVIIFRGGFSDEWEPQAQLSLVFALAWSVGALFLALLPIVLVEFGLLLDNVARTGLVVMIVYMLTVGLGLTWARRRVRGPLKLNFGLSTLFLLIIGMSIAAATGVLPGEMHAWYALAIVLLLLHGTAEIAVFVLQSIRAKGTSDPDDQ